MDYAVEYFKQIGLTEYEGRVYIALAQFGALTGYRASKLSNVPKANCYSALSSLVNKGFVYKVEGDSVLYKARPFSEIRLQIEREMEVKLNYLSSNLKFINDDNQQFTNIEGNNQIVEKLRSLIINAEKSIYIDIWEEDINQLIPHLELSKEKGINIVLVLIGKSTDDISKSVSYVVSHSRNEEWQSSNRDFSIVVDNIKAFSGQIGSEYSKAVFSANTSFVNLATDAFEHDLFSEVLRTSVNNELKHSFKKVEDKVVKILMG